MEGCEGPLSLRGEEPWRRAGRTILGREELVTIHPVNRLSRIEQRGRQIPVLSAEELRLRQAGEASDPRSDTDPDETLNADTQIVSKREVE